MCDFMFKVVDEVKINHVKSLISKAYGVNINTHIAIDNPVSLDNNNINLLSKSNYTVSFKADGTRYIMVLCMYRDRPLAALVNRAGVVYTLHIMAKSDHFTFGSVFDGELCNSNIGTKKSYYDFLVFNALMDQGAMLHNLNYPTRLSHIRSNFSSDAIPSDKRERLSAYILAKAPSLNLMRKEYESIHNMRSMQHNIITRYKFDGFIFTPNDEPVFTGRNEHLLKWKTNNYIDICLIVHKDKKYEILVDNNGNSVVLGDLLQKSVEIDIKSSQYLQDILKGAKIFNNLFNCDNNVVFNHIIEVDSIIDPMHNELLMLKFIRLRPDKNSPNNIKTIQRTLKTIQDNVTLPQIYSVIDTIKYLKVGME